MIKESDLLKSYNLMSSYMYILGSIGNKYSSYIENSNCPKWWYLFLPKEYVHLVHYEEYTEAAQNFQRRKEKRKGLFQ